MDLFWSHARYVESAPANDHVPSEVGNVAALGDTLKDFGEWSGAFQLRYFRPQAARKAQDPLAANAIDNLRAGYRIDHCCQLTTDLLNLFDRHTSDFDCN